MNRTDPLDLTLRADQLSARDNSTFRARRLAACVAAAVSPVFLVPAYAAYPPALYDPAFLSQPLTTQPHPSSPNPPWIVQNCDNDGAGSLRQIITSLAQSGDTVDLSQLTCSTITLTTGGEIVVAQNDLTLLGPATASLIISGNDASRVFHHTGSGLLDIERLTITHGYAHASSGISGGCIYTSGSVRLFDTKVTSCTVSSETGAARGGGISAQLGVSLIKSTLSENSVMSTMTSGGGGGVKSNGYLVVKYSSITANTVHSVAGGMGGGVYVGVGDVSIMGSTIDHNYAPRSGGLELHSISSQIMNSTISENSSNEYPSLYAPDGISISNTTIALNHANMATSPGAVCIRFGTSSLLESSIIANNTAGINNSPSDLSVTSDTLSGADNLVISSNQNPPGLITVTADPKLGPLQFNGGLTRTHALLRGSPAIGKGNNNRVESYDQRGIGYPRSTGAPPASTDIGAFEFDTIFADAFD